MMSLVGIALCTTLGAEAAMTLAADGASEYVIVVAEGAIPAERTAARELCEHLALVTGATLPVVSEAEAPEGGRRLVVGPGRLFREAFPDLDPGAFAPDTIVLRTVGDTVYLAGARPRGTLYAVYTFLEDVVGVRWWTATESRIPETPVLTVPPLDVFYAPALRSREAFYRGAFDPVFSARTRCNGHHNRVSEEYGGHYSILGWCHTFDQLLPPETYFDEHPEWYSEINGERLKAYSQLCLTNDDMRAELVRKALEWIRKDPGAGIISISQNDWGNPCQCAKCRAVEEIEGGASGPLIHFVNAVAAEIEKEFPDMLIETLAYQYTRQAPKHARPRHNVIIRLCSIECSFAQPLATGEQNAAFAADIKAWSAIAHQLFIWDYVTNFETYILPHPNMRVLAPNIRFFVENKAVGLFEQGDSQCSISDFPELRTWVLARLMWDPARDERALIREFLEGYYGPAAGPLQQYIDIIHNAVARSGVYMRCYMPDTSLWFEFDDIARANEAFDEAQRRVADDPVLAPRVRRARMPLDHVWLKGHASLRREAEARRIPFPGPADMEAFCEEFIETAQAFDAGSYREGRAFSEYVPLLRGRVRAPGHPPAECAGLDPALWSVVAEFEFRLAGLGPWCELVDDAAASNGAAVRMPATHSEWAVQFPISRDIAAYNRARCYVVARCDAKAASGAAFDIGLYDAAANVGVARRTVSIEEAAGSGYRTIELGTYPVGSTMYFWMAPAKNPDQVEAVYIDRIFFIRDE